MIYPPSADHRELQPDLDSLGETEDHAYRERDAPDEGLQAHLSDRCQRGRTKVVGVGSLVLTWM